ncbi:hypothetical protein HXX76_012447 [Chlamydomonas incerta]|uniref:Uncharacterized protein n=1 Tax=Chlamydomonas incerta TaxID=51695 RepID=A0A835SWN9_CHLIN|nr:hypothetical protein HXX76_012447 [Chlamydomonas incerta]|eukprot:KAG2427251.1 hypothetical protein HXX76_012447 [Chlamydomonas incerta]
MPVPPRISAVVTGVGSGSQQQLASAAQDAAGSAGLKPHSAAAGLDVGWRSVLLRALGVEKVPADEAAAFAIFEETFVLSTSRTGQVTDLLLLASGVLHAWWVEGCHPVSATNAYALVYLGPGAACALARLLLPRAPLPRRLAGRGAELAEALARACRLPKLGLQLLVNALTATRVMPVPVSLMSSYFRGPSFLLLEGVIMPITGLVPFWAAAALALVKAPLLFGNMRVMSASVSASAASAPASGHGAAMGTTEALLRSAAAELLALATCLGCHAYLWREFGRRTQTRRMQLEQGQVQQQQQQQQGASLVTAKVGMAKREPAAAMAEAEEDALVAAARDDRRAAVSLQAQQQPRGPQPQEQQPLQQPRPRPPRYQPVCRRASLVIKIPWAEPEDMTPDFRRRLVELVGRGNNGNGGGNRTAASSGGSGSLPGGSSGSSHKGTGMVVMAAAVRRGCIELVLVLGVRDAPLGGGGGGGGLRGCLDLKAGTHVAGDHRSSCGEGGDVGCAGMGLGLPFNLHGVLRALGLLDSGGQPQAARASAADDGSRDHTDGSRSPTRSVQQLLSDVQVHACDLDSDLDLDGGAGANSADALPGLRIQGLGPRVLLLPSALAPVPAAAQQLRSDQQWMAAAEQQVPHLPPLVLRARLGLGPDWDSGSVPEVEAGLMLMERGCACVAARVKLLGPARPRQHQAAAAGALPGAPAGATAAVSAASAAPAAAAVAEWEVEVEFAVAFGDAPPTDGGLLLDIRLRPGGAAAGAALARRAFVPLVATSDGALAAEVTALAKEWPVPDGAGLDSFLLDIGYWLQAFPLAAAPPARNAPGNAEPAATVHGGTGGQRDAGAPPSAAAAPVAAAEARLQADIAEGLLAFVQRVGKLPATAARLATDVQALKQRAERLQRQQQVAQLGEKAAPEQDCDPGSQSRCSKAGGYEDWRGKDAAGVSTPASVAQPRGKVGAGAAAGEGSKPSDAAEGKERLSYEGCGAAAVAGSVAYGGVSEGSTVGGQQAGWLSSLLCVAGLAHIPAAQRQAFAAFEDAAMLPFTFTGHVVDAVVLAAVLYSTLRAGVSPLDSVMWPAVIPLGLGAAGALAQLLLSQHAAGRLAGALRLPCHASSVAMKVLTAAHVLPHPLTSLQYYRRLAFPLREGLMVPFTCLVSPMVALVLFVVKVPVNAAVMLDVGAAAHLPAALLRSAAAELLALATCLGCHAYLWREFGRRQARLRQG